MEDSASLDRDTVLSLLNTPSTRVFQNAEQQHPWRIQFQTFDQPLLRVWDHNSGSQPSEDGCMRARAVSGRLDTFKPRKESLTVHISHRIWTPTSYISSRPRRPKLKILST